MRTWRLLAPLVAATLPFCAHGTQALSPLEAINRANPSIVDWRIIGSCKVGNLVQHWIPVAWGETSAAGQSFIQGVRDAQENTSVLRTSGLESSRAVRVFRFTNELWKRSAIAQSHSQRVCSIHDATVPGALTSFDTRDCENAASVRQRIASVALRTVDIEEIYASRADSGWLSGCRDKAQVDEAIAVQVRCDLAELGAHMQPGGTRALEVSQRHCIGRWGSMFPRQARDIGQVSGVASAKTVLRAMSSAREHLGNTPFPVDAAGKFQLAAPARSNGFQPGSHPLPAEAHSLQGWHAGWIYWRKVTCCL